MPGLKHVFEYKGRKIYFLEVVPTDETFKKARFGRWCTTVCGSRYERPHFSCYGKCWIRRIWTGNIPPVFEIKTKTFLIRLDRERWKKGWILKCVMTLIELLFS